MPFIKKYWGILAGAIGFIFFFAFRMFASNKDASAKAGKINSEMNAINDQVKGKGESIDRIQEEAEESVKKTEEANEKFKEDQEAIKAEKDIKKSSDLGGVWGFLLVLLPGLLLLSGCGASHKLVVLDLEKETAFNESFRKPIPALPLPEVLKEKPEKTIMTLKNIEKIAQEVLEGSEYIIYDTANHNLIKAKLKEGKRYREHAKDSDSQLERANRKTSDLVDILNLKTYQVYTLQNSYNECAGELAREKMFGIFYQGLGFGGLALGLLK